MENSKFCWQTTITQFGIASSNCSIFEAFSWQPSTITPVADPDFCGRGANRDLSDNAVLPQHIVLWLA